MDDTLLNITKYSLDTYPDIKLLTISKAVGVPERSETEYASLWTVFAVLKHYASFQDQWFSRFFHP